MRKLTYIDETWLDILSFQFIETDIYEETRNSGFKKGVGIDI